MSLTTDHDDDLLVAVPDYDIIDTLGQSFGRQHARYRIVCKEGGHAWEVQRRWTELRVTIDALKATHVNAFSAGRVDDELNAGPLDRLGDPGRRRFFVTSESWQHAARQRTSTCWQQGSICACA